MFSNHSKECAKPFSNHSKECAKPMNQIVTPLINKSLDTSVLEIYQESDRTLSSYHYRYLVEKRGLPANWVLANCRSVDASEASELLHYSAKSAGLWIQGESWQGQFKPDKPWKRDGQKKAPKYRTPAGDDYDAILPTHPEIKNYWHDLEVLKERCWKIDGKSYLIITEGVFKAIVGMSHGLPIIALMGVEMGLTSAKADPQGKRYLVPTLERLAKAGFNFIIAFDADCATNDFVVKAEHKLIHRIKQFGCECLTITGSWTVDEGKGMDDFIQANGIEAFRTKLLAAREREDYTPPKGNQPPTPKALANELADEFRDKWAYDLSQQTWRIWNGKFWEREHEKVCLSILKAQVEAMGIDYPRAAYLKDTLELLSLILIRKTWETFDRSEWIAGINGVLSLTTGKVKPHQPGFGFTSVLPHEVMPFSPAEIEREILRQLQENCPEVHHFFSSSVLGSDQKTLKLLAVVAGILRFRFSKLQKFVHLIGDPGTGKGTFMRLLKDAVGSINTQSASLTNLSDGSVMARIIDAQLALFPDERKQVGVEWLLKLTGGDDIDYRKVYTAGASSPFHGSVVVASNSPVFSGDTTGLDRRLCLIPFQHIVPSHQRDPELQDRLKAEVPKLVSVALAMPQSLVDDLICGRGIGQMDDIRWHEWQMKVQMDKVAAFIDEMVVADDSTAIGAKTLFEAYLEWSNRNNHSNAGSLTFFGQRFRQYMKWLEMSESKRLHGCVRYIGIRLREKGELTPPIQDLLALNCPPETGGDTLGDTGGTPCNLLSETIGDTRDTSLIKDFLEQTEIFSEDSEFSTKKFSSETVPTLPYPLPEQDTDSLPDIDGGHLNPPPSVNPSQSVPAEITPGDYVRFINPHKLPESRQFEKLTLMVVEILAGCLAICLLPDGSNKSFGVTTLEKLDKVVNQSGQYQPQLVDELHGWEHLHSQRSYPNPKSNNIHSSQKRALAVRGAFRAAGTKDDLLALLGENGGKFSKYELLWVQDWLKNYFPVEYQCLMVTCGISQPSLFS
jgi:putative DNA primase/helicase